MEMMSLGLSGSHNNSISIISKTVDKIIVLYEILEYEMPLPYSKIVPKIYQSVLLID